jgi:hypothetical protein
MHHAQTFYRKPDGTPTGPAWNRRAAMGFLDRLYGTMDVALFTPQGLKAVRQVMIRADWCRKAVNRGVNLVRSVFRGSVSEGMVPVAVRSARVTLAELRKGHSEAREGRTIQPVPDASVNTTLPHLSPTDRAMVELQRLTGKRPVEVWFIRDFRDEPILSLPNRRRITPGGCRIACASPTSHVTFPFR